MANHWSAELARVGFFAFLAIILGLLTGQVLLFLFLVTLGYLAWHLVNLFRLERWLYARGKADTPQSHGIWDDVYNGLYRMQQRNRKRRKRLTRLLNRFQESAAAMPDATVILGERGTIEWWNDAAGRLLGLRPPQDVGQRVANLVRHPAFTDYLARGDYSEPVEFPSPAVDDTTLSVRIVSYGRNQRLLLARDITRLQRLEQMRRDFVANVSHELRTPLTVINGYLEAMQDAGDECADVWGRSINLMDQQTRRMQRIVEDLLYLSRLEIDHDNQNRDVVDVPGLLTSVREEAQALSGERAHVIELEADSGLLMRGNAGELRSAFSNLAFNAVQYTPEGGRITLRWYRDGAGLHYEVQDTGIGVPAHHLPRLTERFYRVDVGRSREKGGTGLGLAIVKHILNRHEGELKVTSEVGRGSTFACVFPAGRAVARGEE